jgi:aspartyl-tRNA(Asn)/glutamyl-tRNA(Gln) amidotransferase subunit B
MAKVEVKNMNSFKAVYRAMEYEAKRLRKAVAGGERLVQETRGWVEEKGKTVSQRSKEYAHDYRYLPEPDLPPLVLSRDWVEEIKAKLPELPEARRDRFVAEYDLPVYDANLLTSSKEMADYEEEFVARATGAPANLPKAAAAKIGSNWLLGEVSRIMNTKNIYIVEFRERVSPDKLAGLTVHNSAGTVSAATAKSMLEEMFNTGKDPDTLLKEGERIQISDTQEVKEVVSRVITANAQAVADYKAGKTQSLTFLVGQVMKATRGRANPKLVNEALKKMFEEE